MTTAIAADCGMDETGAVVVRKNNVERFAKRREASGIAGRDRTIVAMRSAGYTLEAIAADFCLTRQRVHQICSRGAVPAGPAAPDGGGAGDSPGRG